MRFNKIVYIGYFPLTSTVFEEYYFETLLKNNITVEYLDVTNLFFSKKTDSNSFNFSGIVSISSYKEVKDYFRRQNNSDTLYISFIGFEWRAVKLFRLLTKYNLTVGVFGRGVFPSVYTSKTSKYLFNLKKINFNRLKIFIQNRLAKLSKTVGYVKTYDYIFKAGEFGHFAFGYGCDIDILKASILDVNTVDYDKYLLEKRENEHFEEKAAVYLDQYFPYHPDTLYFNIKTVEPDRYYKELNTWFDIFERQTGKKVIIAAHPKALRYNVSNPFEGREIVFNKSNELVKNASVVLTHNSTAVCYPICYGKKLVLLTNKHLEDTFWDYTLSINAIKNACGATIICMDNDETNIPADIDYKAYDDYKYKYLTSKSSEDRTTEEIFLNFILNGS